MVDGVFASFLPNSGWRYMLGLAAVPSLIMFIGFRFFLPESPRWLVMNGFIDEARDILISVRDTDEEALSELREIEQVCLVMNNGNQEYDVDNSYNDDKGQGQGQDQEEQRNLYDYDNDDLLFTVENEKEDEDDFENDGNNDSNNNNHEGDLQLHGMHLQISTDNNANINSSDYGTTQEQLRHQRRRQQRPKAPSFFQNVSSMMKHAPTRRALVLGCGMMILQQLSGINTVMYYAASIYEMSGFEGTSYFFYK